MSNVRNCPTCGAKAKIKEKNDETIYQAVQDEEAFKKIVQLKKAMQKFKDRAERLGTELEQLKMKS